MDTQERQAMMKSMMAEFFGGMSTDEKKDMCAAMMGKMTEGLDMKVMMPKVMMGMMSGGGAGKMREMMSQKMQAGSPQEQMPAMMLKSMMPHCIGMMLPAIAADDRAEAATAILTALVDKGTDGMSEAQSKAFRQALDKVLHPSA